MGITAGVWLAYRTAARHLGTLLVPAVLVLVPFVVAVMVSAALLVARHALFVNGELTIAGAAGVPILIWFVAVLVLGGLAVVVATAATVVLTAGIALGSPVTPGAALATALRRLPALVALFGIALLVVAAIVAAGSAASRWTKLPAWLVLAAMGILLLLALPYAATLPAVVLDRCGVFRAFGRAHEALEYRRVDFVLGLLTGAVVLPGLASAAVGLAAERLDGLPHLLVEQTLRTVVSVLAVPFAAATLTVFFLPNRDDSGETAAPPAGASVRRRALLVAAMVLPGLLYTGYAWANPLRLPAVIDHEVLADPRPPEEGPPRLHHGADRRPIVLAGDTLVTCPDVECSRPRHLDDIEVPVGRYYADSGTVALPAGRIAVATWVWQVIGGHDERWLQLFSCAVDRCDTAAAPVLSKYGQGGGSYRVASAAAATPYGAIVVAHIAPEPGQRAWSTLDLIVCADVSCARPGTVRLGRVPAPARLDAGRVLSVATGTGGTVVVAYQDGQSGVVTIVTCDTPSCQSPVVTTGGRPAAPASRLVDMLDPAPGLDAVIPAGGAPVVAYREAGTGTARLLVCRSWDCAAGTDDIALTAPDSRRPAPALALDRAGRPMVVTHDLVHDRLVLITCADVRCTDRTTRPLARLEHGSGDVDVALTPDGRPQVLHADTRGFYSRTGGLRLTTCATPDCR